jgi:hypothetical protein
MGHRPQTAERVYNRMPGVERRRPALELASQLALGFSGYGARNSGTTGSGAAAAALGVRGGAAAEGTGMNTWSLQQPRHSSTSTSASTSSRWSAAARAESYSSEEEELTLDDDGEEQEQEEEHESPSNHDWIDACLRSTTSPSSSSSSSTLPLPFRTDLPPASTAVNATHAPTISSIGTTTAATAVTPATATEGAPMRCKTPGCDGSGSTRFARTTHCSMRCCPRRHQTQVVAVPWMN